MAGGAPQAEQQAREAQYVELTSRSHALGLLYAKAREQFCCALSKRLLRHEDELFQFVLVAGLSADNNLAERSIRPLVVTARSAAARAASRGRRHAWAWRVCSRPGKRAS